MVNGTMMQCFHWYTPDDGTFWIKVKEQAKYLAEIGINSVWLPPAHKGQDGPTSSGYDVYDLYDLGEFNQKGAIRTRFGTKQQLKDAILALHENGIHVYVDIVLNHMGGADETERVRVMRVNEENRNEMVSEPIEIEAYTKFTFPGRKGKYSQFVWDHMCFSGVDYAKDLNESTIFTIMNEYGDGWEEVIDEEKGNYDYLMFCDTEFRNPAVREELKRFTKWYLNETGFDGVRLDAIKHISPRFIIEWIDHLKSIKPDAFIVGEYWAPGDLPLMLKYLEIVGDRMSLFDASLHHNLYRASLEEEYDLRTILDHSLVAVKPDKAVTVVDNHDTQPLQALEAFVEKWFRPHAYALILLREGGYPCIFYPDLFGATYKDIGKDGNTHEIVLDKCTNIEELIQSRNIFAFGPQHDYFDQKDCIGWIREGTKQDKSSGCAVILSSGGNTSKKMQVGKQHAGKIFIDFLRQNPAEIKLDKNGTGNFPVNARSVSVWVDKSVRSGLKRET